MNTSYTLTQILQLFFHSKAFVELLDTVFPDEILTWSDEIPTHILHLTCCQISQYQYQCACPPVGPVESHLDHYNH